MRNIRLYINDQLIDCTENISFPITYQLEDFKNPTAIKNSFSKTITIPGTDQNNKIFGEIYKLDRFIADHTEKISSGIEYNPSKRVDFKLYNNAELIESGYMQLNNISIQKNTINYEITLYGGIGDFFYSLKYKENGEIKTIADLRYFIKDHSGALLPKESELNFTVNKDLVANLMNANWSENGEYLEDFLAFCPAYNGQYENFDSEHCIVNHNASNIFPTNKDGYGLINGYSLLELNKAYNEWEVRDLRSYKQRPLLKLSKLIETICRKENSGYDVEFDESFFNKNNPYWSKTFVALPLLGSKSEAVNSEFNVGLIQTSENLWCGLKGEGRYAKSMQTNITYFVPTENEMITSTGDVIDMSKVPDGSVFDIDINFQFTTNLVNYRGGIYPSVRPRVTGGTQFRQPIYGSVTAQLLIFDGDSTEPKYVSEFHNFTNTLPSTNLFSEPSKWTSDRDAIPNTIKTRIDHFGQFGNKYFIETGNNTFTLSVRNIPRMDKCRFAIRVYKGVSNLEIVNYMFNSTTADLERKLVGYAEVVPVSTIMNVRWNDTISSGTLITKRNLLRTEKTPLDFLLSYTKLFGLYFVKDVALKKINILTRDNFFKNQALDWSDRIDYSKNISVNPIIFDKKWYTMSLDTPETYFANKYKTEYGLEYGQKRLDTGYNFNAENTDLYTDNIFQNIIPGKDSSKYYRLFRNKSGYTVPCFLNDNVTQTLYKSIDDSIENELYGINYIDTSKTTEFGTIRGSDVFSKLCFFTLDADERSLEEIEQSLVMFNGIIDCNDSSGNKVNYFITDDIPEMLQLNGESCWLWTESELNSNNEVIAIRTNKLPQYLNYTSVENVVTKSLDFGLPREIYDDINYSEGTTLYDGFWKSFYNDQFDVNTKKIVCFVKLDDLNVNQDLLRQFYYFDNSYWILNKIDSFDIQTFKTTRCEFIKVQSINNYVFGITINNL